MNSASRARRYAALALTIVVSIAAPSHAQSAPAPVPQRAALLDVARFTPLGNLEPLPPGVAGLCADGDGRLALPGEHWTSGDVRINSQWPMRRVIWAARSRELFVVHFEQGGFAHTYHVAVVETRPDPVGYALIWQAAVPRLRDYANFVAALEADDFSPESSTRR